MPSIGETLRQVRLRQGLTVDEIAERTRISARLLEALEAEEWDKLPGRFFARAFLHQYASFLGVEAGQMRAELARLEVPAETAAPSPAPPQIRVAPIVPYARARRQALGRWLGSIAVLVLVVLGCAGVYAIWQRTRATPIPAPGAGAAAAAPASELSAPHPAQPAPPVAERAATPPPAPASPVAVEIRAAEPAWIRVTSDGTVVFSDTLQPGQSRIFQAAETLHMRTGNAGGLDVVFNGKPVGPLGPRGHIRELEFTPAAHRILEPTSPPAPAPAPDAAARGAGGA